MSWLDIYAQAPGAPARGLYLGSHDATLPQTVLEFTGDREGGHAELAIRRWTFLWPDEVWKAGPCVALLHKGDWHRGADRYRAYFRAAHGTARIPRWVQEADGWFGCGGPGYTFPDLPKMLDQAEELGLNYLQLWSEMTGGDEGYQTYLFPNPAMGTPKELKAALSAIHHRGGHVGFYLNYSVYDSTLEHYLAREKFRSTIAGQPQTFGWKDGWQNQAILDPEGHYRHVGNPGKDAYADGYWVACPSAKTWQDYAVYWIVQRWAREYGADAWYLDSVPPGYPYYGRTVVCFNTGHGHARPLGMNPGVLEVMRRLRTGGEKVRPFGLLNEGVCDFFMKHTTHVLGVDVAGWYPYGRPEVFTYTFPDFPIFSGTANTWTGVQQFYPGEKVTHEDAFDRVHLMGFRYDVLLYPAGSEGTPLRDYLKRLIALRKRIKRDLYASDFRDTEGLGSLPERVDGKSFRRRDGRGAVVTLLDRRRDKEPFVLEVFPPLLDIQPPKQAILQTLEGEQRLECQATPKGLRVTIPPFDGRTAAVVLR
jgi:hypothetical protein